MIHIGEDEKGYLRISWQAKKQKNPVYFRHIFVNVGYGQPQFQEFIQKCYYSIKAGDFISILGISGKDIRIFWFEKKQQEDNDRLRQKNKIHSKIQEQQLTDILNQIAKKVKGLAQSTFLTMLCKVQNEEAFISKIEKIKRNQPDLPFIINCFGQFNNQINNSTGINKISWRIQDQFQVDLLKKYFEKIVLSEVRISVSALIGELTVEKNLIWENTDLNCISRSYFGLTSFQTKDLLYISSFHQETFPINLSIDIFVVFLNGKHISLNKEIRTSTNFAKRQNKTLIQRQIYRNAVEIFPNFFSEKNPFRTQLKVRYAR